MVRFRTWIKRRLIALYLGANNVTFDSEPHFVGRWPRILNHGKIILGDECRFREYRTRHIISTIKKDAVLEFGAKCYIGDGSNICAARNITIGAYTQLAPNVTIYDTNFHPVQQGDPIFEAEVVIGKNVWIGEGSMIMPGVTVGDHSVIGANSVVANDIPARVVAAGSPAKVIDHITCDDDWIRRK